MGQKSSAGCFLVLASAHGQADVDVNRLYCDLFCLTVVDSPSLGSAYMNVE